jgi:hypothetical protein
MVISRDALKATDHARGTGDILASGFAPFELHGDEGAAPEPVMNRSVVTIRLLIRAPYCDMTANDDEVHQRI